MAGLLSSLPVIPMTFMCMLVQIFAHKTDAPEPGVWALYHRLAFTSQLPNSTGASDASENTTTRRSHVGVLGNAEGGSGLQDRMDAWARRSSVDDTLWIWGLGDGDAGGVWRESDGDGCAVIEALKSANIGVTEVSLRLLRVSVSGDELPVSLSGLCDVRGYVTAVGLEQRLRSACRAPLC